MAVPARPLDLEVDERAAFIGLIYNGASFFHAARDKRGVR